MHSSLLHSFSSSTMNDSNRMDSLRLLVCELCTGTHTNDVERIAYTHTSVPMEGLKFCIPPHNTYKVKCSKRYLNDNPFSNFPFFTHDFLLARGKVSFLLLV